MIVIDENIKGEFKEGTYIALGSFDGLHKGHMTLIHKVVDEAMADGLKSAVYTFKNHPLTVAKPELAPKLLMDNQQKIHLLKAKGVDATIFVSFTLEYMQTEAEEFILSLIHDFNAKGFVVGFNYKYGYQNKGNVDTLREMSERYGFKLFVMDAALSNDDIISSTRIRNLILKGQIKEANELLFEPFMLRGTVIGGKKLGRKIGFPTANMSYDTKYVIPKTGVYYTNLMLEGTLHKSITSVGYNPTVDGKTLSIETYILDFDREIYGEEVKLYFVEYMRDEEKYANLDELVEQLKKDEDYARNQELSTLL